MTRALVAVVLLAGSLLAQTPEEQLQAKLASPFLKNASWHTDYNKAIEAAAQTEKLIFGYFTTAGY